MTTITTICEWLESTALAAAIQESRYGFQIVVASHILGLTLSVGTLLWVDLRLMGLCLKHLSISQVYRGLAPWFTVGYFVMVASGMALFTAYASSAYANVFFRIKVVALLLAAVNALAFHFVSRRPSTTWDGAPRPPASARIAGLTSIVLWATVIIAGRTMSYTMF